MHCDEAERSLERLAGFETGCARSFPTIGELRGDASLAQVIEQAALNLQAQAGCPVTFSQTHVTPETGTYQVVVEYSEEDVGKLAFEDAIKLVNAALTGGTFDDDEVLAALARAGRRRPPRPLHRLHRQCCRCVGVPFRRLTQGSLVQFGWGAKRAASGPPRSMRPAPSASPSRRTKTSASACCSRPACPCRSGRPVSSPDDAWAVAQEIGLPVVVKPQDGNQGKGVTVNVTTREGINAAYKAADDIGPVMVEKFLPGGDYRLLVVGDKLVAAARRDPPHVRAMAC